MKPIRTCFFHARRQVALILIAALTLQGLMFLHTFLLLRYGVSLQGDVLEIGLLAITLITSLWVLRIDLPKISLGLKGLYVLVLMGLMPLSLTVVIMGLCIYATDTIGIYESPSGQHRIALKHHVALLGCSVRPYRLRAGMEHRIYREDNRISCFALMEPDTIQAMQWSGDEAQLMVKTQQEAHVFELHPKPLAKEGDENEI